MPQSEVASLRSSITAFDGDIDPRAYDEAMDDRLLAKNTKTAYEGDWRHFNSWCKQHGHISEPASEQTLLAYLHYWGDPELENHRAGFDDRMLRWSTLSRRLASVRVHHGRQGLEFPSYPDQRRNRLLVAMKVIKKAQKYAPIKARAIGERLIVQMANACADDNKGIRDRALLLTGYLGGLRRSEITNLDLADVLFVDEGMKLTLRGSKGDREHSGQSVYIPFTRHSTTCAVRTLHKWLSVRGNDPGPLFLGMYRGGQLREGRPADVLVDKLVRTYVEKVGENPEQYSAHSLRSGLVTSAALANAPIASVQRQTRHGSLAVLSGYIQEGRAFEDNAVHFLKNL